MIQEPFYQYPKIHAPFKRDMDAPGHPLIPGDYARPEFQILSDLAWDVTEKIDGTNLQVSWFPDTGALGFGGRTVRAEIPIFLVEVLERYFSADLLSSVFDDPVVLFGEGFGAKVQRGGGYVSVDGEHDFALFDVFFPRLQGPGAWAGPGAVSDIAVALGVPSVPHLARWTLREAIDYVRTPQCPRSGFGQGPPIEGVVLTAPLCLRNAHGGLIKTKVKRRDFVPRVGP